MNNLRIRAVSTQDLDVCFAIESIYLAPSEAVSRVVIEKRVLLFPYDFVMAELYGRMTGHINNTAT